MTALAANSPEFLIASDLEPEHPCWPAAVAQVEDVRAQCAPILGFDPVVKLVALSRTPFPACASGETFVFPAPLDFSIVQKQMLGQMLAEARRASPQVVIHHDDVDPGHPLVVTAFADRIGRLLSPGCGCVLAASGHGDPASRAECYRLMRLIWEELSLPQAEVGFVRHSKPFLGQMLEACRAASIPWVVAPLSQWETEHVAYARVILENMKVDWAFVDPPGAHPALTAWYTQRITRLWQQKRERDAVRVRSPRSLPPPSKQVRRYGASLVARVPDREAMAELLSPLGKPDRVLVKVTWHGYATGTYTDPAALDLLLSALPAPAIVLEGHTSSRNLGGATFDWETEARKNRAWIRQQEAEYLRRTGLADVITRHKAEYVNVTEAFWDEEFAEGIPTVLLAYKGSPLISFAKMKGPTRLGISNLFGLLPEPLRSRWHGPNITYFARVCCGIAKSYGALFPLYGMVEGLYSAVRWNRQGLYRSRWGNYDLISNTGYLTAGPGLVSADILASRLQGQDVHRSAFFGVVREELGWDDAAAEEALPEGVAAIFA
jgi:sirohydrochlorin ferrochelatase